MTSLDPNVRETLIDNPTAYRAAEVPCGRSSGTLGVRLTVAQGDLVALRAS